MQTSISLRSVISPSAVRMTPVWFWVGLVLVAAAWWTAWYGPSLPREHTFFPLWLGYILVVDGFCVQRRGSSLLSRDWRRFLTLFVLSVPLWWVFEFANRYLGNWRYELPRPRGAIEYTVTASLAFSTVIPAIFATAELLRSFTAFSRKRTWISLQLGPATLIGVSLAGLVMFLLSLTFPRYAFPLVWIGLFLFLDPINTLMGNPSVGAQVRNGRWDTVLVIGLAGLTCGLFWELWNVNSMPKWVYEVPFFERPKLFEMPLLGYGGYLPFALEVFAFWALFQRVASNGGGRWLGFTEPAAVTDPETAADRA